VIAPEGYNGLPEFTPAQRVEITCDRVAFIKHGEVIRTSTLQGLVEGELSVDVRVRNLSETAFEGLKQWSLSQRQDGEHISLTLSSEADLPAVNRYLVQQGADVYALRPQHVSLEELFIEIVGTDGGL
jgi:ABC-2 type transport system ATP-binding protein